MTEASGPSLRKAVTLAAGTSILVPLSGLLTAPLLARSLGTDGRGELAAAIAPAVLITAVATVGLPEALTFYLAKDQREARKALRWSSAIAIALGIVCLIVVWLSLPFLSGGSLLLGRLILLSTAIAIPTLVLNMVRGAATGRQLWRTLAFERLLTSMIRIVGISVLFFVGHLTLVTAVLVSVVGPLLAGLVYISIGYRKNFSSPPGSRLTGRDSTIVRDMLSYGGRAWLGSVASMLLSRTSPLLMVPLSSARDLGIFSVASMVADLPLFIIGAIQSTLFGVTSKTTDIVKLTAVGRLLFLLGAVCCAATALTCPLWLPPLFGSEFSGAVLPTVLMLLSSLIYLPSIAASTALSAWGRPDTRSLGIIVTLFVYMALFLSIVPNFGVYGACVTSIISSAVLSAFMVYRASRLTSTSWREFCLVGSRDFALVANEAKGLYHRARTLTQRR